MKILDKYTIKGFILPLSYCLVVFYLLYIVADLLGHLDDVLKNKVPVDILLKFYLLSGPLIYVQIMPIVTLLATVYLLSNMNKNNELTAMKASGISIAYAVKPIFIMAVIICLSIFYINETIVPQASLISNKIRLEYIESAKKDKGPDSIKNLTVYGKANQMIYAKNFDTVNNKLNDIIILDHDKRQNLKRKILAKEGVWLGDKWRFYDVIIYRFDELGQPQGKALTFENKIINLTEKPSELLKGEFMSSFMNYSQLKNYINRVKGTDKRTVNRLKTDLYFKLSLPFIAFIMMLLGIPFTLTTTRGGVAASVGISVIIGLMYYALIGICLAFGKGNFLPPLIAAHIPNVLFFIIAVMLIKRAPA